LKAVVAKVLAALRAQEYFDAQGLVAAVLVAVVTVFAARKMKFV
jgi:hypothetical protein